MQEKTDLRGKSTRNYEIQFPDFYYSESEDGWFCKTCVSFASSARDERPFIDTPGGFGDHPSHRAALHLASARHKQSILNKQAFNELRNNHSKVYKLLVDASLSNEIATINQNRFVIKSFFRVIHFMVIKNWGYTQNFKDVIEFIGNCGGNELKTHLLSSLKNALYTSPVYISRFIGVIDDYLKLSIARIVARKVFHLYCR